MAALAALLATVGVVALLLVARQLTPPAVAPATSQSAAGEAAPAAPPVQQTDWKSKGPLAAPVVIEEWGDFQ
ncbi:MAG TPA: hypothetical protein VFX49_05060 [Chloroflexota bacterium]|nr:hypothetical protein [Chloroflexota bacterium]